jgi:cytochrome c biogenesis protein CcmG, thiol:disulfide interchange protein DsbE
MTKSSRASRREAARRADQGSASRWLLPAAGVVIAAVAVIAVVLSQGGAAPSATPSASTAAGPSSPAASGGPPGEPTITGAALPRFTGSRPDPAAGLTAPVVHGSDYAGAPVSIEPNGRVTMVIFAAHWCPHCQREIPVIQAWVDGGGLPSDVDIVTVSTGIDPTLPNYPPEDWFAREGWTAPVIVDPTNSVAAAYGLASYPYFVILDGQGAVFARTSGEVPIAGLEEVLAAVPRD